MALSHRASLGDRRFSGTSCSQPKAALFPGIECRGRLVQDLELLRMEWGREPHSGSRGVCARLPALWLRAQLPISGLSSGAVGQLPVPRFMLRSEGFFEDGVENRGQQVGWWSSCWRLSWLKALPAPCTLALSEETFCWVCPCRDAVPYLCHFWAICAQEGDLFRNTLVRDPSPP